MKVPGEANYAEHRSGGARDLLERVPRACVAFVSDEGPQVELVTVLFKDDRYLVGMPSSAASHPTAHEEVVLLVDDGVQFFDLRAIYVRGHVRPLGGAEGWRATPSGSQFSRREPLPGITRA